MFSEPNPSLITIDAAIAYRRKARIAFDDDPKAMFRE
jgi:hypothetical protein